MSAVTEEAIIRAAKDIFVSKGYAATRMQEIADAANINKAMLHYYFRSKEMLFRVITIQTLEMMLPKFLSALQHEGTVIEKIENIVITYIETIRENPHIPLFIITELSQKRESFIVEVEKRAKNQPIVHAFFDQVTKEIEAGKIRDVPPMHLFLNVVSLSAFPFILQPVFTTVAGVSEAQYGAMMQERTVLVTDFIKNALRP